MSVCKARILTSKASAPASSIFLANSIPVSYTHLVALAEKNKADEDYIRFQLEQLEDAHLATGEQEELEQEDVYKRQACIRASILPIRCSLSPSTPTMSLPYWKPLST